MSTEETYEGITIWFKHSYGFIKWEKNGVPQKDLFIHYSDITNQKGYKTLRKNQKVSFQLGLNHKQDPKAINVLILEDSNSNDQV